MIVFTLTAVSVLLSPTKGKYGELSHSPNTCDTFGKEARVAGRVEEVPHVI